MFTIEKLQFNKQASESETSINLEARRECEDIMKKIYDEDPSYWPYGLNMASHDGGVYMIREASTKKPIGFTGWQERMDGNTKVGFYSIGILPEYRHNGYAKQAVAKLIAIKSANVDRVQALVMKHNKPSLALADALHIPVVKCGSEKRANKLGVKDILKMIGFGGIPAAAGMDALTYGRDKTFEEYANTPFTANRAVQALANVLFGGLAAKPGLNMIERAGVLAGIPAKDVAISAIPAVPSLTESIKSIAEKQPSKSLSDLIAGLSPTEKAVGAGLGAAGLLGAGYLGSKALGSLKDISEAQQQSARGKIRVALPTKDPNDQETIIEMPIEDLEVSRTQFERLQRDLRRRIRKETKERTVQKTLGGFLEPKEAKLKKANINNINRLLNILHA
jgi:ribosomal protein S18 acetylase RimI-like enzyme